MSQLPRVANATLADAKITRYLLNPAHPTGAAKARFFVLFGFSPANWAELKSALLEHPHHNPIADRTSSPFGETFEVSCSLVTAVLCIHANSSVDANIAQAQVFARTQGIGRTSTRL